MEKSRIALFARLLLLAIMVFNSLGSAASQAAHAQSANPAAEKAAALLANMTPEERVGQLFITSFNGSSIDSESPVFDLIARHHLGGVVLMNAQDNFVDDGADPTRTARQVNNLVRQLQQAEWNASIQPAENPATGQSFLPVYAPLFVGISQEGDGWPFDQIQRGLTELPSQMAVGATWKTNLSVQVGSVLGEELSILGVNLLLGPNLDVLDSPQLDVSNNLGVRAFGGDPFWVAGMGAAYIRGVHQGSAGRVAVAARHFPGHGSSDRLPEDEVATVRKSLDELKAFDLAPFFAVTGNATSADEISDALMTSHIRYQGLQGNIRATTRPVSLDPQALGLLMQETPLATWRNNGGVMISDDLGNPAVRRFYELTSQTFDARRVALNAFLAGNDLLYIADFSSASEPNSAIEAVRTLDFFTQKYREDAAFAQRVDQSALRILTLKYRLYPRFLLADVMNPSGKLSQLAQGGQVTFDVARQSATLLSPTQADLDTIIPDPPNQNDRIVFISDVRTSRQCSTCPEFSVMGLTSLQDAVLRLYGPQAGGLVTPNYLTSFSLQDLQALLDAPTPDDGLTRGLQQANWIVVSMLGRRDNQPSFNTLQRFLTERPDLFQNKRIIVFAFTAPYYLDATTISKLTAYYALYSHQPQFIDTAAYLLFGELRASGSSPVSVSGIGYSLNTALFPNPAQVFPLEFDLPAPAAPITSTATPEPPPTPEFRLGDAVPLRTGIILDHNGNPVPDGTPVTFIFSGSSELNNLRQTEVTRGGMARTTYLVSTSGAIEIHAETETSRSNTLRLDIPFPGGVTPTATSEPSATPTATAPPPTDTPVVVVVTQPAPQPPIRPNAGDWLLAMLTASLLAFAIFRLSAAAGQVRWGIRAAFLAFIGGGLAYLYMLLKLPGAQILLEEGVAMSIFLATLIGGLLGLAAAFIWRNQEENRRQRTGERRAPSGE
jgi:beta-N-acetylhexosaminidase